VERIVPLNGALERASTIQRVISNFGQKQTSGIVDLKGDAFLFKQLKNTIMNARIVRA
jgi:hypothetical protein